ncbi:MAG: glycosyltransferase family 4 protein [Methylocystaceae bacterium]|nr:glycosyltransferase family 4 protein [Methylocystaceae bacterium]
MKIILIHNFYGSEAPSGENSVYEAEKDLLIRNGNQVIEVTRDSDEIRKQGIWGAIKGAFAYLWSPFSFRNIKETILSEEPDIIHVHNMFPLISPSVFFAANKTDTPIVFTLHNYRLFCASGIPLRDGLPCTLCLDQSSTWPSLRYGCYRGSRFATLPLAASIALHRKMKTWESKVDAFITLTDFQRDVMFNAGLPLTKLITKPHFYSNASAPIDFTKRDDHIIFVGRLSEEKGVKFLIQSWVIWGEKAPVLDIVGEGPLGEKLRVLVEESDLHGKVIFHGKVSYDETQKLIAKSKMLVLPSICFEGFPMVIREAFALGVPVAASRLGSMSCLVEEDLNGILFSPGDPRDMYNVLKCAWEEKFKLESMAKDAFHEYQQKYTEKSNYKRLIEIYKIAINRKSTRGRDEVS